MASIPSVPVPLSPGTSSQASEPTLSSSSVTLSWNAVSGATSYEVAVRDMVTNQLVVDQIVSGTSYQASLSAGGSYRWNVDAIDSAGASNFSSPLYFLTQASVSIPAVPVPLSPGTSSQASEPTLSGSSVTLSWNAVSGATSYEVAVRDMVTNQLVVDQIVSGTSYQASLSAGGSYRWNVDAIDSAGASNFSSPLYFLTQASVSIPAVPVPLSPGTSSQASEPTLSGSSVTLSWNAVSGATSYEVAVRDMVTNQLVVDQIVSGTSYQASLSAGGSYRWNVDAIDSAGASNFSSPLYFLTQASVSIPAVPVPLSPGTSSQASEPTLSSSSVTLSWNAVSGATSYEVAVRDMVTNQLVVDQIVSGTSYQASLSAGGSYRWNVDAIDSAGASNFSSPLYFLTQGGGSGVSGGIDYRVPSQTGTALTGVSVSAIRSDGYQFVGEYIGNAANSGYLTQTDAQALGLPIVSIFERSPDHIGYFTVAQADADANSSASAITAASNVAHQPLGTAIYFAVDPAAEAGIYSGFGALSSTYIATIKTYFQRISDDFAAQGNPYKIGIYGPGDVLTAIKSLNLPDVAYYWVDTHWGTSFSGANIQRNQNGVQASPTPIGVSVDTDTALTSDFGQWTGGVSAPVITPHNQTASNGQQIVFTNLFSVVGSGITQYKVWFSYPEGGSPALGTLTNNGTPIALDQAVTLTSLAGLAYTGSATHGTDKIWLEAYNGAWSGGNTWTEVDITDQGAIVTAPVITPHNQTASNGQQIVFTNLFSVVGSGITQYKVWFGYPEGGFPALGTLTNNGTPIALDQAVTLTSLAGLAYTGSVTHGTDKIWLEAYNGAWSSGNTWTEVDITDQGAVVAAPVITPHNQTASNGQQIVFTNLFSVVGSGITQYKVWFSYPEGGSPALGTLTNNGTPIALDQAVTLTSLAGLAYTGSATHGTDKIWLEAYNGAWSGGNTWTEVDITDQGAVITAPVITPHNQTASNGQQILLTDLFSVVGSGITQYKVWFSYPEGGSPALGTLTNNGTPVALDQAVTLTSLAGLAYTGSATHGTDKIWLEAYNGAWSGGNTWTEADITDQGAVITAPVITPHNQTASNGQQIALTDLFQVSGSNISQYKLWFSYPEGGSPALGTLTNNGTPVALDQALTFNSLSGLVYTGGTSHGTDKIWLEAYNGTWSNNNNWTEVDINDPGAAGSLANDFSVAKSLIDAQFQNSVVSPSHLTNHASLVDQIALDLATAYGTAPSNYIIGSTSNTNGYTNGFINVPTVIGNASYEDQCVALLQALDHNVGSTGNWNPGAAVVSGGVVNQSQMPAGSPIATFTGNSYNGAHAAFFLGSGSENGQSGFFVLDQYNTGYQDNFPSSLHPTPYPDGTRLNVNSYEPTEVRFINIVTDAHAAEYHLIV